MTPARRKHLRQLLWLYFWLLIFEGALRKWVLPGLSSPLLLVRDPVAMLALWWGLPLLRNRRWQVWVNSLFVIGLIAFLLAVTVGHGDIPTALYGSRILLVQIPLIFIYASIFDRTDVIRFAWALAWLAIPMTVLMVIQSNLPSTHFLNVSAGGEDTATFSGALGFFRPPGTFSFINGLSTFFTLAASALFTLLYGTKLRRGDRIFCILVGIALVVAQPVSISRSLLAGYLQVMAAVIAALALTRARLMPIISGFVALTLAIGIATAMPAFQERTDAFMTRWNLAADTESSDDDRLGGGLGVFEERILGNFTRPLSNLEAIPFLGYGIGMGTNIGAQRISGKRTFLIAEGAWASSLGEMGLPLGLTFLAWRVALFVMILSMAFKAASHGNRLPFIFSGSSLLMGLSGSLSQPTSLGFLVVSTGLTLAACNQSSPPISSHSNIYQPQPSAISGKLNT